MYVPGGTAVLPSSALMLCTPAGLAGCTTIVLATPPRPDGSITPVRLPRWQSGTLLHYGPHVSEQLQPEAMLPHNCGSRLAKNDHRDMCDRRRCYTARARRA